MAQRKTLNEKQLVVLRWIADNCPEGVMDGDFHRISAASLRVRGLVTTSGRGPTWSAEITKAGRAYLKLVASPNAPIPRAPDGSVSEQLIREVIAAGGARRVPRSRYLRDGVDYEHRVRLAKRHGKVPEGKQLVVTRLSSDELQIDLVDAPEGTVRAVMPVPVPARVVRYHEVVRQFRDQAERHEVSRAVMSRALRILQALVVEAEQRGCDVKIAPPAEDRNGRKSWTGTQQGHIVITADDCPTAVRVSEKGMTSRANWERTNRTYSYGFGGLGRSRLPSLADYESKATGHLTMEIVPEYRSSGRIRKWSDRRSTTLEEMLPELLREVEVRGVEEQLRRREAERKAAERKRAWETAMRRARERHVEHTRAEALGAQVGHWQKAERIRAYCSAAESTYPDVAETIEWVAWARHYADKVDPLRTAPNLPTEPKSVSAEELRPFLDGWSPHGPNGW